MPESLFDFNTERPVTQETHPVGLPLETVKSVARLARLELTAEELNQLTGDLSRVLEYVARLDEVSTAGVEPLVHAIDVSNRFRDDVLQPSLPQAQAIAAAPKTDGRFFVVPSILGDG